MGDVEIRQVHYFIAVAEEGNFTRAAHRLSMTQPALSRAVLALEKSVGAALLLRTPKGVTLTAAGHAMLEEGRSLLAQAGNMTSRVRRAAERNASVTVTGPGCDAALLDGMVQSYNEADPAHQARTAVGTIDDQLGRLRSGEADIALVRAPVGGNGLSGVVLRRERISVLVGAQHRLAGAKTLRIADLAGEPLLGWQGAGPQLNDPRLWPDGLPGTPGPQVSDGLQMLAVVRLGQAVALAASPSGGAGAPEGTVGIRLEDGPAVPLRLVWPKERTTPGIRRFAGHAVALFREPARGGPAQEVPDRAAGRSAGTRSAATAG
ncbi:LysR family transcriptional regulator [Streptomyces sp. JH34]|uniref:LysR family transcriptional regulator n=1 Tax=Streptomyces sp. JH34 TaxID=2793633 RepID=UPI0023F816C5|nr:LysR family transcriptional regulator [Streptomyces sp. JH34]MDF6018243.1 LysR family transcriptional regulator [Streptomyces sp. JH34]